MHTINKKGKVSVSQIKNLNAPHADGTQMHAIDVGIAGTAYIRNAKIYPNARPGPCSVLTKSGIKPVQHLPVLHQDLQQGRRHEVLSGWTDSGP